MSADLQEKLTVIKDEVAVGNYKVDPHAVADAILSRLRARAAVKSRVVPSSPSAQNECSYPSSRPL